MPVEQLEYVKHADRFGFTADEVDDLPLNLVDWYLPLADVLDSARAKAQERNSKQS